MKGSFHHLIYTLLGERRREDDGEIRKGGYALADGTLVSLDVRIRLALNEIPLVDAHHKPFLVLLYQRVDVEVLRLDAARGVYHQDTHVGVLNGAYRPYHRVVFEVLVHLRLLADTRRVHKVEILAELVVAGVDAVARGARNIRHDSALLADKSVQNTAFARIGTPYNGETGQVFEALAIAVIFETAAYLVQ